jgi:outer membrane protein assembly factor BamB
LLSVNDVAERSMASPAVSNGRIYIRTDKTLFAIGK